jgi:hypothetical protein
MRKIIATLSTSVLLFAGFAGSASAQVEQDGLVNVNIGDITIQDVNVAVAAIVAAQVCGVQVGPVVLLATEVDATSVQRVICAQGRGGNAPGITITQN